MIYLHVLILLALALGGAYVAHKSRLPALYVLLSIALLVAATGVWTQGTYPAPGDLCLNKTIEDSRYWNCTWEDERTQTIIDGTCDAVNVSYVYDYCEAQGTTSPEASGATWAGLFILFSLLLLGAGIVSFMGGSGGDTVPNEES